MARSRSYRRFQDRLAKQRAERLYFMWRCDAVPPTDRPEIVYRKQWVGVMANSHCVTCSCFMCGNPRKIWKESTLAEQRSYQHMREVLADE